MLMLIDMQQIIHVIVGCASSGSKHCQYSSLRACISADRRQWHIATCSHCQHYDTPPMRLQCPTGSFSAFANISQEQGVLERAGPVLAQSLPLSMLQLHAATLPMRAVHCASATTNLGLLLLLAKFAHAGHRQCKGSNELGWMGCQGGYRQHICKAQGMHGTSLPASYLCSR